MDVEWKTKETDENGDIYKVYANTGLYDIDIYLPQWHDKVSYGWCVDIIGSSGAEGTAPTLEEAQAAALGFVRTEVAELVRAFGLIDEGWIRSDQQYPPIGESVLVWYSNRILEGCYMGTVFERWRVGMYQVTKGAVARWRPLPPPPTDEEVTT